MRVASGARWTLVASLVAVVAQVSQLVVLARLLSPREFGLIGMLLIVVGFVQAYADLGLGAALIHRRDDTSEQRSTLYWLNVIGGAAFACLTLVLAPVIASVFQEPSLEPYVRVVAIMFVVIAASKQFEVLLQKELGFRVLALQDAAGAIGGGATTIAAAAFGLGVWSYVFGVFVMVAIKSVAQLLVGMRRFRPSWRFRRSDLAGYFGFGMYQLGERSISFAAQRLDLFVIARLLGPTALGFYSFALNLVALPLSRVNPIVTRVAFPALASAQDDIGRLRRGYLDMLRLLMTVNAPLLLGLAAVAPGFIPAVFGAKWSSSVVLVQIMAGVALSRTIGNPIGSLLLARGRADLGFKVNVFVLATAIPTIIMGATFGGTNGVALALLVHQLILQFVNFRFLVRPMVEVDAFAYARNIGRPLALATAMAMVVVAVPLVLPPVALGLVVVSQVFVGALVYTAAIWCFERNTFTELVAVFRIRRNARSAERCDRLQRD